MRLMNGAMTFGWLLLSVWQTHVGMAPALQPTPLEAFAGLPATRIAWSQEVGRLDTPEAHAVVTVLILEDTAQPPDRMRGVRIDLRNRDSKDQVYLGEDTLGAYTNALDEISQTTPGFRNTARDSVAPGGTSYLGAGLFWYGDNTPRVHALSAAYYFAPDSEGLCLSAFKEPEFRFPDQDASQFSAIIARAIDQLKKSLNP